MKRPQYLNKIIMLLSLFVIACVLYYFNIPSIEHYNNQDTDDDRINLPAMESTRDAFKSHGYYVACPKNADGSKSISEYENYIKQLATTHKKVAVFFLADNVDPTPIHFKDYVDKFIVIKSSLNKSTKQTFEYTLPWIFNPLSQMPPISKGAKPRIGFCGNENAHPERSNSIRALENENGIETHFVRRGKFTGNLEDSLKQKHDNTLAQLKDEYENNIRECEFNLCSRGRGNFSMRLYEVLSAGRIPVLTDTDDELPFSDTIPWKDICIIGKNIPDMISQIYYVWNNRDIVEMQNSCAYIYKTQLSDSGIANNWSTILKTI